MSVPVKNFVIRHIAGAKANQVEEFDFNGRNQLTFGRSADNDIQFDPEVDTVVSREHGKIVKSAGNPLSFSVVDNNSRNGLFVNKVKVRDTATLFPGDEIQLGSNGPVFVFDIDPRPQEMMPQTRIVELVKPTSEFVPAEVAAASSVPEKTGIGKQTFERVITHERKKSQRTLWTSIAAAVVILGAVGFVMYRNNKIDLADTAQAERRRADSLLAANKSMTQAQLDSLSRIASAGGNIAYDKIASDNTDKVVKIYISWELYEVSNNAELRHEYYRNKDGAFQPLFIRTQAGLEPYLTTKDNSVWGLAIGSQGTGSGFVVSADGKILTNRHVGAAWKTRYGGILWDNAGGKVVRGKDAKGNWVFEEYDVSPNDVFGWVPSEATLVNGRPAQVEGRNKYLKVVFANSTQPYEGHLVTASQSHDVSLIKVDVDNLEPVSMMDNYEQIKSGQGIVVMGYPGGAPQQRVVRKSNDPFKPNAESFSIASPVTSPGHIQQIVKSSTEFSAKESAFGDSYQLDLNATGGGNSGGPMFDEKGNVIGIYYAGGGNANQGIISFAVPIKYGMELLSVQKAN